MKNVIIIIIFLTLIASAIYAVEKVPSIKGITTTQKEVPSISPTPTQSAISDVQSEIASPSSDVIFNVPAIMDLKKDEILAKLGQPTEAPPEPPDGAERGGTWRMVFEKNGKKLLVLYQLESKEVYLAYIEGDDKDELIKISGAKKDASNYAYDFFMDIQDTNKVVGIRFEKRVPTKINASIIMSDSDKGFLLTNNEGVRFYGCEFLLNDNYWFSAPEGIEVNKPKLLKYVDFRLLTQRDKEFDILTMKPKKFDLKCDMVIQKKRTLTVNF